MDYVVKLFWFQGLGLSKLSLNPQTDVFRGWWVYFGVIVTTVVELSLCGRGASSVL